MRSPAPPKMLTPQPHIIDLPDETATAALGAALAPALGRGDIVFLRGVLGAGKTVVARAVIRALLGDQGAEVPSPSYTLVNLYETPAGTVWHVDLYRLAGSAAELEELGLDEAWERAILLIEWPERLGAAAPARRLEITLTARPDGTRRAEIFAEGAEWDRASGALAGICR